MTCDPNMRKLALLRLAATLNPCCAVYVGPSDPENLDSKAVHYDCHREAGHEGNHFGQGVCMEWSDEESRP